MSSSLEYKLHKSKKLFNLISPLSSALRPVRTISTEGKVPRNGLGWWQNQEKIIKKEIKIGKIQGSLVKMLSRSCSFYK